MRTPVGQLRAISVGGSDVHRGLTLVDDSV
jgi:hypothetical protein